MQHLAAYYEAVDPNGNFANIEAVPDPQLTIRGDNVQVPQGLTRLQWAAVLSDIDGGTIAARLESPTLRDLGLQDLSPFVNALTFGDPPQINHYGSNPRPLTAGEDLTAAITGNDSGTPTNYVLVSFSSGPESPANGEIFTYRFTAAASLSAGAWVNSALTEVQTLPYGRYDIVGLRVESANGVGARLVFQEGGPRPGVPVVNAIGDLDCPGFRMGQGGVYGSFQSTNLPSIDVLGVTDTAQVVYLDLIKRG